MTGPRNLEDEIYAAITGSCLAVAAVSAILFDKAYRFHVLFGIVGTMAGIIAVGTYFAWHSSTHG